jgi:predicted esterase
VVLHGYGQLAARFIRHFAPLADGTRLIVAPEALSRFYLEHPARTSSAHARIGASWMTREDREAEIADQVEYLDAVCDAVLASLGDATPGVHVLGFSQGVATATRWLAHGRTRASHVILWSGRIPADLFPLPADNPLRAARIDVVTGADDPLATPEVLDEQRELVSRNGLIVTSHRHAGGHRIDGATLSAVARGNRQGA